MERKVCYADWLKSYYNSSNTQYVGLPPQGFVGADFNHTKLFVYDYFARQNVKIYNYSIEHLVLSQCEYGECPDTYKLTLLVDRNDIGVMKQLGFSVIDIPQRFWWE